MLLHYLLLKMVDGLACERQEWVSLCLGQRASLSFVKGLDLTPLCYRCDVLKTWENQGSAPTTTVGWVVLFPRSLEKNRQH